MTGGLGHPRALGQCGRVRPAELQGYWGLHRAVAQVVFGATDPRAGAAGSVFAILGTGRLNHRVAVRGGVLAEECGEVLRAFFKSRR